MSTFTTWAKDVALRAVKTAAQAAVAAVTANTAGVTHLDLGAVGAVAGLAAVTCVLQNLASLKVTAPDPTIIPAGGVAGATLVPDPTPVTVPVADPAAPVAPVA